MPDLDYVTLVGRFGIVVGDGSDPDDEPDVIWCDEGEIRLVPLNGEVKIAGGSPVPWTGGVAVVDANIDTDGYLSWRGKQFIQLVDLTSEKVNPTIGSNKATHRVEFRNVKADSVPVSFTSATVRIAADTVDLLTGTCDLTKLLPVQTGNPTPIYSGPRGTGVTDLVQPTPTTMALELTDGTTTEPITLPVGPGGSDAGVAGYLADPASASAVAVAAKQEAALKLARPALPLATNAEWGPAFVKTGVDLATQAETPLGSIYIPTVINVEHIPGALGNWYMYLTTDHSLTTGGIVMLYADELDGEWTVFAPGGTPFVFTVSGALQVEWAQVIWNPDTSLFHIFFHMGLSGELTRVVTSPTGLLNDPANSAPQQALAAPNGLSGDGLTCYLNPFRIDHTWIGYILDGGKNHANFTMAYSNDGILWQRDPARLGYFSDLADSNAQRLTMHTAYPFFWRGQVWTFLRHAPHDSGLITTGEDWALCRLTADFRGPTGRPKMPAMARLTDEASHIVPSCVVEHEGYLYAFYRANGPQGSIRVAKAEA